MQRSKRGQKNKLSLTTLLIGLVSLAVLLTSTILLVASYQSKKQSLIDTTLVLNYRDANKMSQTIDSLFRSMRVSMQYSADKLSGKNVMSNDEKDEYLELLKNSSNFFNSMAIIDEHGLMENLAPKSGVIAGKYVSTEVGLEAIASQAPYLSDPYKSDIVDQLIVLMTQPIFDPEGNYRGIIAGTIYLEDENILTMIFGSNNIDDAGSYYYIVGRDGRLLFHPDKDRISEDVSANKVVQDLIRGNSGQERVVKLNGEEVLAGYSSVPANGWGVVRVSRHSVMHDELNMHLKSILWYIVLPFGILLLTVIMVARELARPFVYLANLVSKIGKEKVEIPERKPHWNREADLLTKTILLALKDIQKQTDQLTQEAKTDSLTGLTNRRSFEATMDHWIAARESFSLIILDVDKFKYVNDTFGHLAGDEVLKKVAQVILDSVRPVDICCRYGGEEFVILLEKTTVKDAFMVAERVRRSVERGDVSTLTPITVSQGIAHFPAHAQSSDELFHMADQALYQAKKTGRNQTVVALPLDHED